MQKTKVSVKTKHNVLNLSNLLLSTKTTKKLVYIAQFKEHYPKNAQIKALQLSLCTSN